jgi:aspartate/methionine/tyrosine aminotransferase
MPDPSAPRQSRRLAEVQAPMIPVVAAMIARHPGTISLAQGVVHYGPPAAVAEAVAKAAAEPATSRYGRVRGLDALLERLETKLSRDNHVSLGGRRVFVTAGGNMAFLTALLAIADPGDEVILFTPFYFNHDMAIAMANCRTVPVATTASRSSRR